MAARVAKIPAGAEIEVRLFSKEKLRGRLGEVSGTGFILLIPTGNRIDERRLAFDDVKSIKVIGSHRPRGPALPVAVAGVVVAVIVLLAVR
ncbi:MAG: hypothetical protein WBF25_08310 [Terriglobales bacterium]